MKEKETRKKEKDYLCQICKGDERIRKEKNCCSKEMTSKEKGTMHD